MRFDFTSLAFGGENHIVRWDAERIRTLKPDDAQNLAKILEVFGKHSAAAQSLGAPITDILRLRSTDQRLYLYMYRQSARTVVLGGIKVGTKRLFVRTISAELREIEPLCVLDFYVHESCQRQGVGKELFEHMLTAEGVDPGMLAYDRPSPKLVAFLKKHYGLTEYVPQSNNYVVFNRFWELCPSGGPGSQHKGRSGIRVGGSAGGHPHPLHAPRSTPPPGGWGPGMSPVPTSPLVGSTPTAGHQSPSFGQRWATSNFGSTGGAVEGSSMGQRTLPQGSMDEPYDSGYGANCYPHAGDSLDEFSRGHATGPHQQQQQLPPASLQRSPIPGMAPYLGEPGPGTGAGTAMAQGGFGGGAMGSGRHGSLPQGSGSSQRPYASRPPWAVDEPAGTGTGLGMGMGFGGQQGAGSLPGAGYGHALGSPQGVGQGPVGGYGEAGGLPYGMSPGRPGAGQQAGTPGPHTRALQEQLNAMQLQAQAGAGYAGGGPYGMGGGQQQLQERPGLGTPGGPGVGGEAPRTPGTAKMMAVAQRSGAGAADCLVW